MEYGENLMEFLIFLEFQTACSIEINNLDFRAEKELTYKKPINLN